MNKILAACAFLALATPALANNTDSSMRPNSAAIGGLVVGEPVLDPQNHQIGTIERITKINGQDAAVISAEHVGDTNDVALKIKDLHPTPNGNAVVVAMSGVELFGLQAYAPGEIYPLT